MIHFIPLHCMAPPQLASSTWHATVEALFLHPEYNRSSVKGFDNCDVGTTMKKEPRNTRRATLKVTSNRFKRNLFAVMIQVLVLIGLVRGQAGKVSEMLFGIYINNGSFSRLLYVLSVKDTIMSNEHPIRNDEQTMQVYLLCDDMHTRTHFLVF